MSRVWDRPDEPDAEFVRDADGMTWQRCREYNWELVEGYQEAGLPKVGSVTWYTLLGYGPLTEVDPYA